MQRPVRGAERDGWPVEVLSITPLTILQNACFVAEFLKPVLEESRRDVEEYPFIKLLDRRQPRDFASEIGPVDRELNLVQLAFGRGRRRLKPGKGVEACDLAQAMNPHNALTQVVPPRREAKEGSSAF